MVGVTAVPLTKAIVLQPHCNFPNQNDIIKAISDWSSLLCFTGGTVTYKKIHEKNLDLEEKPLETILEKFLEKYRNVNFGHSNCGSYVAEYSLT